MDENNATKLARIHKRIFAYLIDTLLVYLVFVVVTQNLVFVPIRQMIDGSDQWFLSGWKTEFYTLLTISLPTWLYIGLSEITPWQATVGKRIFKLQTLDEVSHRRMTITQTIIRTIIKMLPWEIAHLTNNFPVPIWYDPNPGFRVGFVLVPLLATIYLFLGLFTKHKQSLHDLIANTIVVRRG